MRRPIALLLFGLSVSTLYACGDPQEAPRVALPVVADPSSFGTVTTDLGYEVELIEARVMVENFSFTIAGEEHAALPWQIVPDFLVPSAYAHPGHY